MVTKIDGKTPFIVAGEIWSGISGDRYILIPKISQMNLGQVGFFRLLPITKAIDRR
jgi:hypothetical protein